MPTHSSILAWEIPWTEEPGGLYSMGLQRDITEHAQTHTHTHRHTYMHTHTYTHTHTHTPTHTYTHKHTHKHTHTHIISWRDMARGHASKTLELDPGFTSSVTSESLSDSPVMRFPHL